MFLSGLDSPGGPPGFGSANGNGTSSGSSRYVLQANQCTYNDKYVVHYNFEHLDAVQASDDLEILIHDLQAAGLHTEVRLGYGQTLLIFVKAPKPLLGSFVHKSRVRDWLYGVTPVQPDGPLNAIVDADFEAEDILAVYHIVHWPKELGGAAVDPDTERCQNIKGIFPLHNTKANQKLLRHLGKHLFLKIEDLDKIRDLFGPKVAFYFAFTQTYIIALLFPSITGLLAWAFLPHYSLTYAILTTLWCTVFLEYWKIQEIDLSIRWKSQGVGRLKVTRPQFKHEKIIVDGTGRTKHFYPKWKHFARQLAQIPFVLFAILTLGALIVGVFAIEVLISEAYEGPYKWYLEYLPTVVLACLLPYITNGLEAMVDVLTEFENHRTKDGHETSRTQKIFVLNFITNYLPIFLTAFIYVPFGDTVLPYLERMLHRVHSDAATFLSVAFATDPNRLRNQVIALTLTGQVQHFGEEFLFPFCTQTLGRWYREWRLSRDNEEEEETEGDDPAQFVNNGLLHDQRVAKDHPEDLPLLTAARNQSALQPYNVQEDISQMVIQFGYLALFSPVWPLVPIGFLVNNWFELRSDFLKICIEHQRPAPVRTDGIGPWIHSLGFLNWLGSLSTAAVVHLFASDTMWDAFNSRLAAGLGGSSSITASTFTSEKAMLWWTLPITIFVSEHVFLMLRSVVQFALESVGSEQIRRQRDAEYARRKHQLDALEAHNLSRLTVDQRSVARKKSIVMNSEPFFARQVDEGRSVEVGQGLIRALKLRKSRTPTWKLD